MQRRGSNLGASLNACVYPSWEYSFTTLPYQDYTLFPRVFALFLLQELPCFLLWAAPKNNPSVRTCSWIGSTPLHSSIFLFLQARWNFCCQNETILKLALVSPPLGFVIGIIIPQPCKGHGVWDFDPEWFSQVRSRMATWVERKRLQAEARTRAGCQGRGWNVRAGAWGGEEVAVGRRASCKAKQAWAIWRTGQEDCGGKKKERSWRGVKKSYIKSTRRTVGVVF